MIEIIKQRRSIRDYSDKEISSATIEILLQAAMSGPSCVNSQDWSFIVIQDKNTLNKMADLNGRPAEPLRKANTAILVCGDLNKAFIGEKKYWVIDCSIATQNIILAATELKIGSVWLGTYPQMERVQKLKDYFCLPQNIIPHSIVALGYPLDENEWKLGNRSKFNPQAVHYEKWDEK